ncbi:MAG: MFS transporter [Bradymonadaceae bacterium]
MVFFMQLGRVVFAPMLDSLMETFGIGPAIAGTVVTLVWLGSAAAKLPSAYLLTSVPRSRVILASGGALALGAGAMAVAPSILPFAAGAFFLGAATGAYYVAANPLVSELFPGRIGQAMGVHYGSSQVAAIVAPSLVGAVLIVGDYRFVFAGLFVAAVAMTGVTILVVRGSDSSVGNVDRDFLGSIRAHWPLLVAGLAILGTTGLAWNGTFNFYVTFLQAEKSMQAATARGLLTAVFVAGLPAMPLAGYVVDRVRTVPFALALMVGFVGSLVLLVTVEGTIALALASLLLGGTMHALYPIADAYVLGVLPDHHRGSAYSAYNFGILLSMSAGSAIVGWLVEAGLTYATVFLWFGLAVVGVATALGGLYLNGRLPGTG